MNRALKLLVSAGIFVGVIYGTATVGALALDGRVFDLPNHKLLILDGGYHLYSKRISYEFKAGETE